MSCFQRGMAVSIRTLTSIAYVVTCLQFSLFTSIPKTLFSFLVPSYLPQTHGRWSRKGFFSKCKFKKFLSRKKEIFLSTSKNSFSRNGQKIHFFQTADEINKFSPFNDGKLERRLFANFQSRKGLLLECGNRHNVTMSAARTLGRENREIQDIARRWLTVSPPRHSMPSGCHQCVLEVLAPV